MDKTMFRGYVRELVRETVEEEVKKILPKLLEEAVSQVKTIQESTTAQPSQKPKLDRAKIAAMLGMERHGDTIVASTNNLVENLPPNLSPDDPTVRAITRDYSAVMKAMGLTK
jgi:hypothetical protein